MRPSQSGPQAKIMATPGVDCTRRT